MHSIEINPVTGSILVHYHPESHEQIRNLLDTARQEHDLVDAPPELTEAGELERKIEKEAEFLAAHSELALRVVNGVKALNRGIREGSGPSTNVATPLWVTLAIFSFNSFISLRHPTTVHVTTHQVAAAP